MKEQRKEVEGKEKGVQRREEEEEEKEEGEEAGKR